MAIKEPMTATEKAAANKEAAERAEAAKVAAIAEAKRIASLPVLGGSTVLSGVRNNGEFQVPGNPGVTVSAALVNGQKTMAYVGSAKVDANLERISPDTMSLLKMFLENEQERMTKGSLKTTASVGLLFVYPDTDDKDANFLPYPIKGGQEMAVLNRESTKAAKEGYHGAFHLLRKDLVTSDLYCYLTKGFRAVAVKEGKTLKPVTVAANVIEGEFTANGSNGTG